MSTSTYSVRLDPIDYNRITQNGTISLRDALLNNNNATVSSVPSIPVNVSVNITITAEIGT